ncbi:MAG: hypothetical protein RBU45_16550 [Myxococcota bacterium]|jgi:hypothetical protein|nr:hypothetical protein [Myxococcota bacterium]
MIDVILGVLEWAVEALGEVAGEVAVGAAAGAAVVGVAMLVGAYWDRIRETVAAWLREHGLARSHLMKAWVELDRLVSKVRSRLYVQTHEAPAAVLVTETLLTPEELSSLPEQDVPRGETVRRDILELIQS